MFYWQTNLPSRVFRSRHFFSNIEKQKQKQKKKTKKLYNLFIAVCFVMLCAMFQNIAGKIQIS